MANQRPTEPFPDTLTAVLREQLATQPNKHALLFRDESFTFTDLVEQATGIALSLADAGVQRHEPVAVMLSNRPEFVLCFVGLGLAGMVQVAVNTAYKGEILVYILNNCGARVMVVEESLLPNVLRVADRLHSLEIVYVVGSLEDTSDTTVDVRPFDDLRARPGSIDSFAPVAPNDLIGIMYTSGTTGHSKGVMVAHAHAYRYCHPSGAQIATGPTGCNLVALPLFHIGGQWAGVYNAWIAGGTAALLPGFRARTFWDDVRKYNCTGGFLLGAMGSFIYRQPRAPNDRDNPLEQVMMGPLIPEWRDFEERFGVTITTGYALTEGGTPFTAPLEGKPVVDKGCGWLRPDFEARIVDDLDNEVAPGVMGELLLRYKRPWTSMVGYHGMPDVTAATFRNLWLHTGDAFIRDEQGHYYFVDRKKDALRRRGENISSFEVEVGINRHPAVMESAVVGVPSEHTEDDVKAVVVLRDGVEITYEELIDFLVEELPAFMVPRYLQFVPVLPKTPTEKIQKAILRDAGTADCWDRERSSRATRTQITP